MQDVSLRQQIRQLRTAQLRKFSVQNRLQLGLACHPLRIGGVTLALQQIFTTKKTAEASKVLIGTYRHADKAIFRRVYA